MKVVCIDNQKHPELEVNKIYNAEFVFFIEGEVFAEWSKNIELKEWMFMIGMKQVYLLK